MVLTDNRLYAEDLDKIISSIDISRLHGKSVLITGASGMIGSCLADCLIHANRKYGAGITIYAARRNPDSLAERFGQNRRDICFVKYDALQAVDFGFKADYIVNCASPASPEKYVNEPVDTMLANFIGMNNLLKYAREISGSKLVYVSSGEVYGVLDTVNPIREENYGYVDILNVRSSYSSSKRATETLCAAYAHQHGIHVSVVRPGHIYGPSATASDNRVASRFIRQAAAGADLVLKSSGSQMRSYCYCPDCAGALITVMLKGESGKAYNISNSKSVITIKKMAEITARAAQVKLLYQRPKQQEKEAFNPMDNAVLDCSQLENLGWRAQFSAEQGLSRSVQIEKEMKE